MSLCAPHCTCIADNASFPIANDAMPCPAHGRSGDEFARMRDQLDALPARLALLHELATALGEWVEGEPSPSLTARSAELLVRYRPL
jgi:hypothetical protein